MAYTTANGTTTEGAVNYSSATSLSDARADVLLRRAERAVASETTVEDTAQYKSAASDTELAVFEFLLQNPGFVKSETDLDSRTDFAVADKDFDPLTALVRREMAAYVPGGDGGSSGDANTVVITPAPW